VLSVPLDINEINTVDKVWATDITYIYIPLPRGFRYLGEAVVILFPRHVLRWKFSNNLDTELCLEALEKALAGGLKPQIFHSDQSCQFTSVEFVAKLQAEEIKISWSGRKYCFDNILVGRL
jgi:putative transposase